MRHTSGNVSFVINFMYGIKKENIAIVAIIK